MLLSTVTLLAISGPALLFGANFGDVISAIVVLAIIVMSALLQLMGKAKQGQAPGRPGRGGRPMQARGPRGAAQRAGGRKVEDEIAEFLRRAAKRGKPAAAPRVPRKPARRRPPVKQAPIVAEAVPERRPERIGTHLKEHLDTSDIAKEASSLGSDISRTERAMEAHLAETFGRGISASAPGETGGPASEGAAAQGGAKAQPGGPAIPVTAAAGLAALLADTNNLRRAIVLNEILTRPEERWT